MMRFLLIPLLLSPVPCTAQSVLLIMASPDNELACAGTVYRIAKEFGGGVDMMVITNGDAGKMDQVDIRQNELLASAKVLGIRNIFFLDQKDGKQTLKIDTVLNSMWDTTLIKQEITTRFTTQQYDYIITSMPINEAHGRTKAATVLALRAYAELASKRGFPGRASPIILGVVAASKDSIPVFDVTKGFRITAVDSTAPTFVFDRQQKIELDEKTEYNTIVRRATNEYSSQGNLQTMAIKPLEIFCLYRANSGSGRGRAKWLFERLKRSDSAPPPTDD